MLIPFFQWAAIFLLLYLLFAVARQPEARKRKRTCTYKYHHVYEPPHACPVCGEYNEPAI